MLCTPKFALGLAHQAPEETEKAMAEVEKKRQSIEPASR
jgi:hypothetical protein